MRVIGTLAVSGDTQAPTQPQNLVATAINRQRVDLSWSASSDNVGVTGYQIFRNGSPLNTTTATTYIDATVSASSTYTYTVVAFDAAGNNSLASSSAQATTPANASPTWQTIATQTLITGNAFSLNLNNFCTDADADTIVYTLSTGSLPTGITKSGAILSGTPSVAGETPSVTIDAFDGFAHTQTTIVFQTFSADVTAPPVPTGLAASSGSTQIDLTWNASTDVAGGAGQFVSGTQDYRVYRSTDNVTFSLRTTVSSPSYSDTGLAAGTTFYYKVSSRDVALNESAQSASVNATTTPASTETFTFSVEGSGTEWVSFGHPFARGAITGDPVLTTTAGGAVTHQAHVHSRHSDNSVRHCLYSAQLTGGQSYRVASGTAPAGTARTVAALLAAVAGDIARVDLTGGITGSTTVRDLLENTANRARLNNTSSYYVFEQGPQMLGVVVSRDFATHLRVTMHLRWYGGSLLWCDFLFENGYVNLGSMASRSYTATMLLNGVTVGTQAMTSPVHYNRTMWHKAFWSSGGNLYPRLTGSTWTASKAVPNYSLLTPPTETYIAGTIQSTAPMDNGDNTDDLDDTGEQSTLGILPRWDAAFITSNCDKRMFNNVLANADGGMAYNYSCIMDSATGEHLSISDRSTFTSQQPGLLGSGWSSGLSPFDAGVTGTFPAHMPSIAYTAFVATGQWSILRAMHAWSSFTPFYSDTNRNSTFNGKTIRRFYWGSTRGVGWSYRTVGQAAYITPDSHYLKLFYNNEVNGVFAVDAAEYNASFSPIGLTNSPEFDAFGRDNYRNFMHNFLVQATSYVVCDLGFTSGQAFASHVAKFPAGLMGNTGEFKWNFSASYVKTVAATNGGAYYTTFTQVNNDTTNVPSYATSLTAGSQALANAMFSAGDIPTATAGSITGRPNEAASYYANMQPAVAYLAALGVTGGLTCWQRFVSGQRPDYRDKPQFNIQPRASTALALAAARLAPGQSLKFGTIPGSVLDIDGSGFSLLQYMSSAVYDPINQQVRLAGKRSSNGAPYRYLIYRESTAVWSIVGNPVWSGGEVNQNGHGYDHNTIDPVTSINYFRPYNDNVVWYWTPSTGVWASLAAMNSPFPEIAGLLEWIPGTGLVYADRRTLRLHPGAANAGAAWTTIENLGSIPNAYHAAGAYNRNSQVLLWGWGNADNNSRKCGPSLTGITTTASLGGDFGSSEFGGLIAPDPVGRGFVGWLKQTTTWKHYNPDTNAVSSLTPSVGSGANPQTGVPPLSSADVSRHSACTPIDSYGVIMFIQHNGGSGGADVWLYRHT